MNSGWGGGSALILFLILMALITNCENQRKQTVQLTRIADKITSSQGEKP